MMQFDGSTMVFDACRIIREKITEANLGQGKLKNRMYAQLSGEFFCIYLLFALFSLISWNLAVFRHCFLPK